MQNNKEVSSRIARYAAPFMSEAGGIINFLDEIKLWEISEGEIPPQFYTFNNMLKVYTLAFKFVSTVALIGNLFDILAYFWGIYLTPIWYALIFFFLYQRYYGAFGSFGLTVYRTVIVISVITLFLVDNAFKFFISAVLKKILLLSDYPFLAAYIPPYSPSFYHFVYLITFFLPKKNIEEIKTQKLYSDQIVEITAEEYEKLVSSTPTSEVVPQMDTPNEAKTSIEIKNLYPPKKKINEIIHQKNEIKAETQEEKSCSKEQLKSLIEEIDKNYEIFLWDKYLYVARHLLPNCLEEGLKVKISRGNNVLAEGIYLRFKAIEVLGDKFKTLMKERFRNPEKKQRFQGLKVEIIGKD
jgi:hypothetical protein